MRGAFLGVSMKAHVRNLDGTGEIVTAPYTDVLELTNFHVLMNTKIVGLFVSANIGCM